MQTVSKDGWNELLDTAAQTFKVLARAKLRSGKPLTTDHWYDLAAETAERATPRRDVAIIAVFQARPMLLSRALADDARTLAEAGFLLIRDALRDELSGRLNSLRAEVMSGRPLEDLLEATRQLRLFSQAHPDWELFAPRLDEAFELRMQEDHRREVLPKLGREPEVIAAYLTAYAREVLPEGLDETLALIASAPGIACRPALPAASFETSATLTLEEGVVEHLAGVLKRFWERQWAADAA
jgi:hypothetical protein